MIEFVRTGGRGVKLVADAPLEWLQLDGLPLMLRKDCSRVPSTPGNVSFRACLALDEVVLPASGFEEVLILRSYRAGDPLRPVLEAEVNRRLEVASIRRVQLRLVDVADEAGFLRALDEYEGPLMIFDGHGTAGAQADLGALLVGGDRVDLWRLRRQARVPPIVVLSACDTHPLDSSHASTAAGFLAAGARTIVATSLPIDARYAAGFVGRLLFRINDFLPILLGQPHGMARWSELVPGLQRMVYVSETLDAFARYARITLAPSVWRQVHIQANVRINGQDPHWFDAFCRDIAEATRRPEQQVRDAIARWASWTEALSYVQLGNPEQLVIVP
jgi:hypothetical protein